MKKLLILIALGASLVAETLTLSGSVISDNQKMITSRFMGFVTEVNVSEGEKVVISYAFVTLIDKYTHLRRLYEFIIGISNGI